MPDKVVLELFHVSELSLQKGLSTSRSRAENLFLTILCKRCLTKQVKFPWMSFSHSTAITGHLRLAKGMPGQQHTLERHPGFRFISVGVGLVHGLAANLPWSWKAFLPQFKERGRDFNLAFPISSLCSNHRGLPSALDVLWNDNHPVVCTQAARRVPGVFRNTVGPRAGMQGSWGSKSLRTWQQPSTSYTNPVCWRSGLGCQRVADISATLWSQPSVYGTSGRCLFPWTHWGNSHSNRTL